jgi:hypothetical protein
VIISMKNAVGNRHVQNVTFLWIYFPSLSEKGCLHLFEGFLHETIPHSSPVSEQGVKPCVELLLSDINHQQRAPPYCSVWLIGLAPGTVVSLTLQGHLCESK